MDVIWSVLAQVIWWAVGVLWWLVSQLLWMLLWLALPLLVVAFVAFRVAGYALGKATVEAWLRRHALRFGAKTWRRVHGAAFALLTAPPRVLFWLVVYAAWHAVLSLLWRPRWSPWQRAWARRWVRRPQTAPQANRKGGSV